MIKTDPKNNLPFEQWVRNQVKKFSLKKYKQKSRIKDVKDLKELDKLLNG